MDRLKSIAEFKTLQGRCKVDRDLEIPTLVISAGTCGQASGANDLIRVTKRELLGRKLAERIHLRITGCHGFCEMEPSVLVEPDGIFYPRVDLHSMARMIEAILNREVLGDLLYVDHETGKPIEKMVDIPFFKRQTRTILSRNEKIDPIRIFDYIENDGYSALSRVLALGNPEKVVEEVKASGLRGRGGAGFPTGLKWEMFARQKNGRDKIIVCNADEGDPGAYMDRSVLEGNPNSILEGMIIGAYATGATRGVIYVRN